MLDKCIVAVSDTGTLRIISYTRDVHEALRVLDEFTRNVPKRCRHDGIYADHDTVAFRGDTHTLYPDWA